MLQEIAIGKLKAHPRNELIYGQEDISDLVAQIGERGKIVVPLIINDKNIILAGHRRWAAAKELKLKTVPCEARNFESQEDELEFLLHDNVKRNKTREQMAREGMALEEVLSAQSAERRNAKLKQHQSVMDDSSTTDKPDADTTVGSTRDEVAKALKIGSGKQFDRMKAVVQRADELKAQGKPEDAGLFLSVLNRAPSAASDLLSVDLTSLSDEDRANIKAGKAAPRAFASAVPTEKKEPDKNKVDNSYFIVMKHVKEIDSQLKLLVEIMPSVKGPKLVRQVSERIEKQISCLQGLLSTEETSEPQE